MSFFQSLLAENNIENHDGRSLWEYNLTEQDYIKLRERLSCKNNDTLDPKDAALYFAYWWDYDYDGGKPSIDFVYSTLDGVIKHFVSRDEFYEIALIGGEELRFNWIKKQNTLKFRTLLLQGGLPENYMLNNITAYRDFLYAVRDLRPDTVDDIMADTSITNLLPIGSRNEEVYTICFEIVRSKIAGEDTYDALFERNKDLSDLGKGLRVNNNQPVKRKTKPKSNWILNLEREVAEIYLRLGLASDYSSDDLETILGFEPVNNRYQFFIDDELICVFTRMLNGRYKVEEIGTHHFVWNGMPILPEVYVMSDGKSTTIKDFIQLAPDLSEPTIWTEFSNNEWRLMKGNTSSAKAARVLYPSTWSAIQIGSQISISTCNELMTWIDFEGELVIENNTNEKLTFYTGVEDFEWTIVSNRPAWMKKTSIPVVQGKPSILVYDKQNNRVPEHKYKTWFKNSKTSNEWIEFKEVRTLPTGFLQLKIEKEGLVAYDKFYNVSGLSLKFQNEQVDSASIKIERKAFDFFQLDEHDEVLNIEHDDHSFHLSINPEFHRIPNDIYAAVWNQGERRLNFTIESPFVGTFMVNKNGDIIKPNATIYYKDMYGLRILSKKDAEVSVAFYNSQRPEVKIIKPIKERTQSVTAIVPNNELERLFYLSDMMNHENSVLMEISEGRRKDIYYIKRFTHTLNIEEQNEGKVSIQEECANEMTLYAIPVKAPIEELRPIQLRKVDGYYELPGAIAYKQLIVFSSCEGEQQLMPRFVDFEKSEEDIERESPEERIERYHDALINTAISENDGIWQEVLKYVDICLRFDLPFSTFDQIRAISRSSEVAVTAFFFFAINQRGTDEYIQSIVPKLENELGFCFHWANKDDWGDAVINSAQYIGMEYFSEISGWVQDYFQNNQLGKLGKYILSDTIQEGNSINHQSINSLRSALGEKVLKEMPNRAPNIHSHYGLGINDYIIIRLLFNAPIAVAESILGLDTKFPIWGGDAFVERLRRNIQYSHYITPEFYSDVIQHVLKRSKK